MSKYLVKHTEVKCLGGPYGGRTVRSYDHRGPDATLEVSGGVYTLGEEKGKPIYTWDGSEIRPPRTCVCGREGKGWAMMAGSPVEPICGIHARGARKNGALVAMTPTAREVAAKLAVTEKESTSE